MNTVHNKLTAEVITGALALWSNYLVQLCPVAITPSFVMDQTARAGP